MKGWLTSLLLLVALGLAACDQAPVYENVIDVNRDQAAQLLSAQPVQALDLRTPGEFNSGHINGALNFNYYDKSFQGQLEQLDRNLAYLVYCQTGGRSSDAMRLLNQLGFKKIYHLYRGASGGLPKVP
ncbi:MAG: rhodanese-like domain-containing protein [bacterium]|nr:rhodanese-like domain-containing protein [bacterium]